LHTYTQVPADEFLQQNDSFQKFFARFACLQLKDVEKKSEIILSQGLGTGNFRGKMWVKSDLVLAEIRGEQQK
jgi:hypothetical protein